MNQSGASPPQYGSTVPLPRSFYDHDVVEVARALLGKLLVRVTSDGSTVGRIVEVEAYLAQDDPASHAHRGQTRRNAAMFGPPGHAYVYTIHTRWCLNAVTEPAGVPSAVLIRAVEPLEGLPLMHSRRGVDKLRDLTRGPGRLCEAFAVDRQLNGCDLTCARDLWIAAGDESSRTRDRIETAARVGVSSARDLPLRFFIADSPFVSKPPPPGSRSRAGR